jgi:hypothetical protein
MRFHRSVTIARYLLKRLQICDLDDAPLILDHTGPLEGAPCDVHAVAPRAQHLSQVFLGQGQDIAAGQVARSKKPTGQALLHRMRDIAGGRLLSLGKQHLFVPNECRAERDALLGELADQL